MEKEFSRRKVLQGAAATGALLLGNREMAAAETKLRVAGEDVELQITTVSPHTFRLSVLPLRNGTPAAIPVDGSLVRTDWGAPVAKLRQISPGQTVETGNMRLKISSPLDIAIENTSGEQIQRMGVDGQTGALSFLTGTAPLLGLGEGGPQFDRRGSVEDLRNGEGASDLRTHGARVTIPWLIGAAGWAIFFHHPFGTFDFSGQESTFQSNKPEAALPLDIFFVSSREPATIMAEYARLTGLAEKPPLWSFGYQQSHRTLSSREEILGIAKKFREKKLPCDALIYLGTGFCPSGWNTANGSFEWNRHIFPDPKQMIDQFHREHLHVVLHVVILTDKLDGTVRDRCELERFDETEAGCYWDAHRKDFAVGIDGWWPDEGDRLDPASRLRRNQFYWEGPQTVRPDERPYALNRNGYAGMQRYASFLWSGDVYSTWETLKVHIPNAINTALSGIPYWGTDIGGFVPTKEFTAELYLRWFQFAAFCPLFRAHGRAWKLRLPWQWDSGETGPPEIRRYGGAALPGPSELHNPHVEPICRKYLELRYRMLPYLYSAVHECATTGMPIVRALWLHYPEDPVAVARGDEYLWGRNILVAPVVEQGATSRQVYLPHGIWHDFWTNETIQGGRELTRKINIETIPLYVRAGSILPMGPLKQYVEEEVDEPLGIWIYPGADANFLLYEDDGISFRYRKGEWMGLQMAWNDTGRRLTIELASGSKMLPPMRRVLEVKLGHTIRQVIFEGRRITVHL
ncbi:MAG: TIM-barrel domain-containing protein [Candidatus Acidiferrales bacterium]